VARVGVIALLAVAVGCGDRPAGPEQTVDRDRHYRAACALLHPWTPDRHERARLEFARTDRPRSWRDGIDAQLAAITRIADPDDRARAVYEFRFAVCTPENVETGGP